MQFLSLKFTKMHLRPWTPPGKLTVILDPLAGLMEGRFVAPGVESNPPPLGKVCHTGLLSYVSTCYVVVVLFVESMRCDGS